MSTNETNFLQVAIDQIAEAIAEYPEDATYFNASMAHNRLLTNVEEGLIDEALQRYIQDNYSPLESKVKTQESDGESTTLIAIKFNREETASEPEAEEEAV